MKVYEYVSRIQHSCAHLGRKRFYVTEEKKKAWTNPICTFKTIPIDTWPKFRTERFTSHLREDQMIDTCSKVAIEPWHASNRTRFVSPNVGWDWSLSFSELMSSHPVMKTKTAPGLSFSQILHKRYSMRLKPIQSGFQQDKDSLVCVLYSLKSATLSVSCYNCHKKILATETLTSELYKLVVDNFVYLDSWSNLALPLSWGLFVDFPCLLQAIIINLIIRSQSVSSHFQNIFQEMTLDRICETLSKPGKKCYFVAT